LNRAQAQNSSRKRATISAYIISKNEENNIGRAIGSVHWMDEVIVLDSGSTDKTVDIAKKLGAKVSHASFSNFVEQKNRAMDLCSEEWVFNLDADEEVTPELKYSLMEVISKEESANITEVYSVSRRIFYMGRWIRHCGWYPEYRERLSKKGRAVWKGNVLHERLASQGSVGILDGDLLHRPYSNLGDHLKTIDRYSLLWAQREAESGRKTGLFSIITRPSVKFLKMFIIRAGFLDYGPGLIASVMGSFYTFMKYAKLYELSGNPK